MTGPTPMRTKWTLYCPDSGLFQADQCVGRGGKCVSEGICPESMISYPKPYEKMAEAREGGREGAGREK